MTDRALLRHHLAALAVRFQHALRGAPDAFATFSVDHGVRTPLELVEHVALVLGRGAALLRGASPSDRAPAASPTLDQAVAAVHAALAELDDLVVDPTAPLEREAIERLLHGPLVDAATHIGQLVLLRRLAGAPVAPASHLHAIVRAGEVGPDVPSPPRPS
jgi:hypothetical protein